MLRNVRQSLELSDDEEDRLIKAVMGLTATKRTKPGHVRCLVVAN